MGDALLTSTENGIARMIINRPESRNAMTGDVLQDMLAFVRSIESDNAIRVLLIGGAGAHFAAGGDVKSFAAVLEMDPDSLRLDFERRSAEAAPLWLALARMKQPVVCAVRGFAAGVALSFVAGADYTLASDTAKFLLAHVGIGLVADGATTFHLPRVIGIRKAKELAFFGEKIDADQALALGLVNRIVPDAALEAETEILLQRFCKAPVVSIACAKRLLNASLGNDMAAQLALETQAVGDCGASPDIKEGVRAFTEKRRPDFGARTNS